MISRRCVVCDEIVERRPGAPGPLPIACSTSCRREYANAKVRRNRARRRASALRSRACARCGQLWIVYERGDSYRRYCSAECKRAHDNERQRARYGVLDETTRRARIEQNRVRRRQEPYRTREREWNRLYRQTAPGRVNDRESHRRWRKRNPDKARAQQERAADRARDRALAQRTISTLDRLAEQALREAIRELAPKPPRRYRKSHCRHGHELPLDAVPQGCPTCNRLANPPHDCCKRGHDLRLPGARHPGGGCRECRKDQKRRARRRARERVA